MKIAYSHKMRCFFKNDLHLMDISFYIWRVNENKFLLENFMRGDSYTSVMYVKKVCDNSSFNLLTNFEKDQKVL